MPPHDTNIASSRNPFLAHSSAPAALSNGELLKKILRSDENVRILSDEFSALFRKDLANVWTDEARQKLRKTEHIMILVLRAYNDLYIHYAEKEITRGQSRPTSPGSNPKIVHLDQIRQSPDFQKFKHIHEVLLAFHMHITNREPTPEWVDQLAKTIQKYLFEVEEDIIIKTLPLTIEESKITIKNQQTFKETVFPLIDGYHEFYRRFPEIDPAKKAETKPFSENPFLPATVAYPVLLDYFISSINFFVQSQNKGQITYEDNKYSNFTNTFTLLFRELHGATLSRVPWQETLGKSSHYNKYLTLQTLGAPKCFFAKQILKSFSPSLYSSNTLSLEIVPNSLSNDWRIVCDKDFYLVTTKVPKKSIFNFFGSEQPPKRVSKFLHGVQISIRQLTGEITFMTRNEPLRIPRVLTPK